MLQPKRTKYRKQFKGRNRGMETRGTQVTFGEYGLQATERGSISAEQLEAARRAVRHHTKRSGKMWIKIYPDKPITQKPAEVRQGKGKGSVHHWASPVKPGRVIFELGGVAENLARSAFRLAALRLSVATHFVTRTI